MGVAPAMLAWCLEVTTMITTGGSYWELFGATNLAEGDTLGESGPKYVGLMALQQFDGGE